MVRDGRHALQPPMQPLAAGRVASIVRTPLAVLLLSLALAGAAGSAEAPSTAPAAEPVRGDRWGAAIERGRATLQAMIDRGEAPGCSVAVAVTD